MINIEFLLLIVDYFRTLTKRNISFEWGIPLVMGVVVFFLNRNNCKVDEQLKSLSSSITGLLGVLIGFSIAVVTLLVTTNSKNIEEIKGKQTSYTIGKKRLSLFDLLLINYTYSIVVEIIMTILNLTIPGIVEHGGKLETMNVLNSINIFIVVHILLLIVRNTTDFYFILLKKDSE